MRRKSIIAAVALSAAMGVPAQADDIVPPKALTLTPGGVNVSDGFFVYSHVDLSIGSLSLTRFAQPPSKIKMNKPFFGETITHNFDIYVAPNFTPASGSPWFNPIQYQPIVHIGNTASGVYLQTSLSATPSTFNLEAWKGILKVLSSGAYEYTDNQGNIYTFNPNVPAGGSAGNNSQRVANIVFADGRKQTFSYIGDRLKLVVDTSGYAIVFDYSGTDSVTAACGFNLSQTYVTTSTTCASASLKTSYTYAGTTRTFTDVEGDVTTYTHGTYYSAPILCIKPPGFTTCQIQNTTNAEGRTSKQVMADGTEWFIGIDDIKDPDNPVWASGDCDVGGYMVDPDGKTTSFFFANSSVCTQTDPNGRVTTFKWNGANLGQPRYSQWPYGSFLNEAVLPEGNKYTALYGGPFRSVTQERLISKTPGTPPDLVKTYGYNSCTTSPGTYQNCAKPIRITDPNGNQTDFSYYGWGGTEWEMQPAPTSGASRPLKLYTYAQKYAYVKNSGGTLVPAATAIWTITSETACQTVAGSGNSSPVCDTTAPVIVTNYEYGADGTADNLLLRAKIADAGTGKLNLRTCYSYDGYGNKISETEPMGATGGCP